MHFVVISFKLIKLEVYKCFKDQTKPCPVSPKHKIATGISQFELKYNKLRIKKACFVETSLIPRHKRYAAL